MRETEKIVLHKSFFIEDAAGLETYASAGLKYGPLVVVMENMRLFHQIGPL